jgi:hypothetical protein
MRDSLYEVDYCMICHEVIRKKNSEFHFLKLLLSRLNAPHGVVHGRRHFFGRLE